MFELVRNVFHIGDDTVIEMRLILPTQLGRYLPIFHMRTKEFQLPKQWILFLIPDKGQCLESQQSNVPHNILITLSCYPLTSFSAIQLNDSLKGSSRKFCMNSLYPHYNHQLRHMQSPILYTSNSNNAMCYTRRVQKETEHAVYITSFSLLT